MERIEERNSEFENITREVTHSENRFLKNEQSPVPVRLSQNVGHLYHQSLERRGEERGTKIFLKQLWLETPYIWQKTKIYIPKKDE